MNQFKNKKLQKTFLESLLKMKVTDKQRDLFQTAFVHSSVIQRFGPDNTEHVLGCRDDYERWEFLGDRVMELVSGEYLHDQTRGKKRFETPEDVEWKDDSPNFLTRAKSRMVKKQAFAGYATACNLGPFICVCAKDYGDMEDDDDYDDHYPQKGDVHSMSIMEDVFEAFIGICYECFGYEKTRDFAQKIILRHADWEKIMFDDNYKDKINRYYASIYWGHPEFAELKKEEIGYMKWEYTSCVLSPIYVNGMPKERVYQFQSSDSNSRKKIWLIENNGEIPIGFLPTGSSGFIAGVGKSRKLKEAEKRASLNAMVNFKTLLSF